MNVNQEHKCLLQEFPYLRPLDLEWYQSKYKGYPARMSKIMILLGAMSNCERFRNMSIKDQNVLLRKIETGCFNVTINKANEDGIQPNLEKDIFYEMYSHCIYEKSVELNVNNNQWFIYQVLDGHIPPGKVGEQTPEAMNPEANKSILDEIEMRRNQHIQSKTSAMYECERCGKRDGIVTTHQSRSADEAKSVYVQCQFCKHNFMATDN